MVYKHEEKLNAISHFLGVILSIIGFIYLMSTVDTLRLNIISAAVFSFSMIILYTASTLYHAVSNKKIKKFCQRIDHIAIYLLIAGTYTPFALVALGGKTGWLLFGIIWGLALLGFIYKLTPLFKYKTFSLILYLAMGWMVVFFSKSLFTNLEVQPIIFLILGGLSYTIGVYYFVKNTIPYNHFIWHLFVLAGTIFHFIAIYYVLR